MKYIKGFDGLRAISILFVILTHLGIYSTLPDTPFIKERLLLLISGTTGVQIFFTISGFLITTILLKELNKYGSINFLNFFIKRFLRLLPPLLIFYLVIAFLMSQHLIKTTYVGFLYSFFYVYNFVPLKYYVSELGHTWSLAVEEQYYFIWPFFLSYIKSFKYRILFIFIFVIASVFIVYYFSKIPSIADKYKYTRFFIPAASSIFIGALISIINNRVEKLDFLKKNNLYISFLFFFFPLYAPKIYLQISFILQSLGVGLFLLWIYNHQASRVTRVLNTKLMTYIGKISYGLYVYQGLFLRTGPGGKLWIQHFPQNIFLTIIVSILSYHFIEKYFLGFKNKFRN